MGEQWNKIGEISDIQGFDSYLQKAVDEALQNKIGTLTNCEQMVLKLKHENVNLYEELDLLNKKMNKQQYLSNSNYGSVVAKCNELEKENEELKHENKNLKEEVSILKEGAGNDFEKLQELRYKNCELKNENSLLKNKNEELKNKVENFEESLRILLNINSDMDEKCIPNNLSCGWDVE